jgi:hypothetical protein
MHSMAAVPLRTFDSAARATVAGKQRPGRRNRRSDRTKKQSWKKSRDARYERREPIAESRFGANYARILTASYRGVA